ncbi:MAG: glutamine synthetase family protein [Acidobacteria bacterium]|nr:glutamine synthetase family protein [Acidobacteriota bacterium]
MIFDNPYSYALTNPLSILLNKATSEFQRKDILSIIEQKGIERLTFHYTALDGRMKELKIPVWSRRQTEPILAQGERVDGSSLFKGIVETSGSDLYVVPDYSTAFLNPFDGKSLDFVCRYLTKDGEPARFTPDNILAKASRVFRERTGLELYALGELEFFLISERQLNLFPLQEQRSYHESTPFVKSGEMLNEMVRLLAQITGAVKYAHSEVGAIKEIISENAEIHGKQAEQLEIEFLPLPAEEMAEALVLGRWIVRNVAHKHGCMATFAPKLDQEAAGNGFHFHLALFKEGQNIMRNKKGDLSDEAKRLIGGLCEHAETLTAFGNTVASSYFRLVPDHEAPTRIFWSDLNRSSLIRVPLGWSNVTDLAKIVNPEEEAEFKQTESRQTVELRSPDGSGLVHFLLAGITMAADWGFLDDRALKLAEHYYADNETARNREAVKSFPSLPASCVASSRILEKRRDLYEREGVFPSSIIDYVIQMLQAENDEQINRRLAEMGENERKMEIRRILHKDLHKH